MISLSDVRAARERLGSRLHHTPLMTSRSLDERTGARLALKCECFQKTGSFKPRGALHKTLTLSDEARRRGIVTVSAGNHAQAVAWASRLMGAPCVVVMPTSAPRSKLDAVRGYGAEVVLHDDRATLFDRLREVERERGLTFVHPFDDPVVLAGAGTLGLEIVEDLPEVDVVVVPIGGGGLISGVSMALKALNPKIKIIGVESSDGPAMKRSVEAGHLVTLDKIDCIIDGLRVKRVGENNFSIVQRFVDQIVTLPDKEIFDAMIWIMSHCKLVVEGAAAAPVAALLHGLIKAPAGSKVVAVLSGGNVNLDQLKGLKWN